MFSYFLTFIHPDAATRIVPADRSAVIAAVRAVPDVVRAHVFTPETARDRYFDDGPSPMLTLQLYFERLEHLERATRVDGALSALADAVLPSLADARAEQQAMWTRPYPTPARTVPSPAFEHGGRPCSYLVHYPGAAGDLNTWLTYYLAHHPQVMFDFPGVREVEIFTRVDWTGGLPWLRVDYMQRNKLVFDSAVALEEALHSPTREAMKADRAHFPPFTGSNIHFPMETETVIGPLFAACAADPTT